MGETLFIAHRIPFPPDRGDKIRSHHLLKALAQLGPVHVATLGETEGDFAAEHLLAEVAQTHCLARRPPNLALAGLKAIAAGKPVSLTAFDSQLLREWIGRTLAARPIDTIFVFSGQMGQYVPRSFKGRFIIDLCDVDSAKFDAYASESTGPRRWINRREATLLRQEEARLASRADATLLITDAEAALFRSRIGQTPARVVTVGNGIDTVLFDPQAAVRHPALAGQAGPHLLFTGQMDYPPNVAAAIRTTEALMPAIRAHYPHAQFHIVGRAPTADVLALDGRNGTRVWGEVPDVRPFLSAANLVVAPLAIARGVQNKVLEAMAMARPVLLTAQAATGIEAVDGQHYAVASDDSELVERAITLLASPANSGRMGTAARRFVIEHRSWESALAPLSALVRHAAPEVRDAA
jgi:sugar transferase (PEP-CTERM/EpsH1 system associated)